MPRPFAPLFVAFVVLAVSWLPEPSFAQANPGPGDWGDAPEGALAYPATGVTGLFPTCFGGPSGFIWHAVGGPGFNMYWGSSVDQEIDGNAGFCPPPSYERDECWGPFDGDGGLTTPDTYSIDNGNQVVPCGQTPPRALGTVCQVLNLTPGGPFDANLVNQTGAPGFVNVLFDWNQDGVWGGFSFCGAQPTPEHAIVNVPVPPQYIGPLTGLSPGSIQIGPQSGYVWVRMTLSDHPVPIDWDGSGIFDAGETEDYLLRVDGGQLGEYGDAPDGSLAYPSGVVGQFPTCRAFGPPGYVFHAPNLVAYFGRGEDYETDGNAGTCPAPPYDQDECALAGGDAGLLAPQALSLSAGGVVVTCPGAAGPTWSGCLTAHWGSDVDIQTTNNAGSARYVNLLVDWDGDGQWTAAAQTCPNGGTVLEHVLVDWPVPPGFSGPLSMLAPPDFTIGAPPAGAGGYAWARFTISDVAIGPAWSGDGHFTDGETEDYLFRILPPPVDASELGRGAPSRLQLEAVQPNPAGSSASIRFATGRPGRVVISVFDAGGRRVATLLDEVLGEGWHTAGWNRTDDAGRQAAPGVYFVRVRDDDQAVTTKIVVVR
ncbi:MAG: T9SS type A sorting domain-containing protein [bacterium]